MRLKTHIGMSLDGFITSAEGLPAWDFAPGFSPSGGSHGTSEFLASCSAVVMGRTSFDQGMPFWRDSWPYGDRPVFVLSHRPLPADAPAVVAGIESVPELLQNLSGRDGDAQLLGGGQTFRALLAAGAIDEVGIVILPVLLGSGIPLFDADPVAFSPKRWEAFLQSPSEGTATVLGFESSRTLPEGAVHVIFKPSHA
jgi:dihydrofolate reductase